MIKNLRLVSIVIFCLLTFLSVAQRPVVFQKPMIDDPQIRFDRISAEDGLSHNRITDILQDNHGFIWIATVDGLNRYDGQQFEIYRYNEDNFTSLTSSYITCIDESGSGNLYIGTKKGLNVYDRVNNNFRSIPMDIMNGEPFVRQILIEFDTIIWVETADGYLLKFDLSNEILLDSWKHNNVHQLYYLYHDIYRDSEGILWLGLRNNNPMYLDEKEDKLVSIKTDEHDYSKKRAADMACYFEDRYGNFWFTALDGIYLYDRESGIFKKFLGTTTYDIIEDKQGILWFATGSGVMRYDIEKDEITHMDNQKDNLNSISSNNVHVIMEDDMGNLWFGTSKGVNIYSRPAYAFSHYTHIPGITNSPEGYVVNAVAEDDKENLWIGYEKDGLDYFNRKTLSFTHYLHDRSNRNSLGANKVSALYFDDEKRLWIGLWRGIGFNLLDTRTGKFTLFTYNPNSYEKDWYGDFVEDRNGNFYIGFWGCEGLNGFDRDKGKFLETYKSYFERVSCSRLITKLLRDKEGSIWFGTTDCGLHRFFPERNSAVSFFSDGDVDYGLSSNETFDITEDNNGNIWVINDQLQRYNPEIDTFISFGYSNGLNTNSLSSVVADNNGDIWIGTNADGLYRFNPATSQFNQYLRDDGTKSNSYTGAALKLSSGEIFMGCKNGFLMFNPDDIIENNNIPVPFFGRLYVYDHIVSHDLNSDELIILEPEENVFTLELQSTDVVNSGRYSYMCMLEGYDKDWVEIDNKQRKVRYASVPSGTYKLKYRIGNRKGLWSEKIAEVSFKVNKPYYKSWWFIIVIVSFITFVLIMIVKQREFDLKQKNNNILLQQRLFRLQMNPHFMYNSLLAIQNYIFSHNPMEAGNYLSDFARLFRLILNNSRSEFIKVSKEIETLNLYLRLQSLRYPNKFSYKINIDPKIDSELIMIPPMLAQPMIENALEHGLFYKDGPGFIEISFTLDGKQLVFEVQDNGIGFTKAKQKHDDNPDHKSAALEITRERIKILGKRHGFFAIFEIIEIKNNSGEVKGTKVMFNLPTKLSIFDNI